MLLHLLISAALWLLVRVSMGPELSELRVASGLATGAVDLPLASPVQRRINCSVGPWENVSNGGNLCKGEEANDNRSVGQSHSEVKNIEEVVVHKLGTLVRQGRKSMILIDWLNKCIQWFENTEK